MHAPLTSHESSLLSESGIRKLAEFGSPVAEAPLFSPMQMAVATLLGGALAGFLLLAINYRRIGRLPAAAIAIAIGLFAALAQVSLWLDLPNGLPAVSLCLPTMLAMFLLTSWLQGEVVVQHVATGGSLAAPGESLPIAAGSLVMMLFTLECWRWMS